MSSNYLPSIFYNRSNKKDNNTLSRRATTITSTNQLEEIPSLQRSNTTLSKVKRFGSLLVRNKKNENSRKRADTIFPPSIDTTALPRSNYSLSTTSTANISSDDDDDVVTPTATIAYPLTSHIFDFESILTEPTPVNQQDDPIEIVPVTPETQTNQVIAEKDTIVLETDIFVEEPETMPTVTAVDPETLSSVSLVRYHLNLAFVEVDEAIENEFDLYREQMLYNIHATPTYLF